MRRKEIKQVIRIVFFQLYDIIALYEETDGYNFIPGNLLKDSWKYMEKKISRVRRILDGLSLGDEKVSPKLHNIIDETEHFVKSFERPGTVLRWKQLNPKLLYFDAAFDMMEYLNRDDYIKMQRGLTAFHLNLYPDEKLIKQRNAYFAEIRKKNNENNLRYSEERIFQNEMICTLRAVFEHDFHGYFDKVEKRN